MRIPEIRERLDRIADKLIIQYGHIEIGRDIKVYIEHLKRRRGVRRASQGPKVELTPEMKKYIKTLRDEGYSYKDIAHLTGVFNHGRLSETCAGFRT